MKAHPLFARFYDWLARAAMTIERPYRKEIAGRASGRVLDLGAGTGLNFSFFTDGVTVVAVEPEPTMLGMARGRAPRATARVLLVQAAAEALPFRKRAFDEAVVSLVLCSVDDPSTAAGELRRVLRADGVVRLWEHVRSPSPQAARWQDLITPLWRRVAANCHPNRDPVSTLKHAGFEVRARREPVGPPAPVRPHVVGTARPR